MNHKQKLGYMALGAGILALGIIIGQFVTPDIEAQSNGVFDKVTCRELEVIDPNGKKAIWLFASDGLVTSSIVLNDQNGKKAIWLFALNEGENNIVLNDQNEKEAIRLSSVNETGNVIALHDQNGKTSFAIAAGTHTNELVVRNKSDGAGIGFYADYNEAKQIKWNAPKED